MMHVQCYFLFINRILFVFLESGDALAAPHLCLADVTSSLVLAAAL
jgi:hypothetical protein